MHTVLEITANWAKGFGVFHHAPDCPDIRHRVDVPEPYQAGEPTDICVWSGLTGWAVPTRHSIESFALPSFATEMFGFNLYPNLIRVRR